MALRFGVAGIGYWADTVHIPGLKEQPAIELVGAWGRNPDTLKEVTGRHGIRGFARFEDMLAEVEAVSISLPPSVQVDLAIKAANAGKHLLLEKPIARTVADAERVVAAIERNKVANVVFFTRRYVPTFENALVAAGKRRWTGALVRSQSSALLPGSPYINSVWRAEANGALWDVGPHALAALTTILGPVERISATRSPDQTNRFIATHKSGVRSEASLSLHTPAANAVNEYLLRGSEGDYILPLPDFPRTQAMATASGELAANVARGERQHRCDVRLGLEVVRILAAAERSMAAGGSEVAI